MKNEPLILIDPSVKGYLTVSDLLSTEGTIVVKAIFDPLKKLNGFIFKCSLEPSFYFALELKDEHIIFQRNKDTLKFPLANIQKEKINRIKLAAAWSHNDLALSCNGKSINVDTSPSAPPTQLIKWARQQSLLPTMVYRSEEELRNKIHSCLLTINQKIRGADAYRSFWDFTYNGNKIIERKPKKEVDVQPLIHCFLSDQMLLNNIEMIPEYKSGEGLLDFLFIGFVEDQGLCSFCAEFKLAHSKDLYNGLWHQLPKYMNVKNATYGAYCVFDFRGEWFNKPVMEERENLYLELDKIPKDILKPEHSNIRNIFFDLGKPITASKSH